MPITFADNRATVTLELGVDTKGGSFSNPWRLNDILIESDIGGWGMVKNGNHYYIPFSIWVEDDAYFAIYSEKITFDNTTDAVVFYVTASAGGINIWDGYLHTTPPMSNGNSFYFYAGGLIQRSVFSGFWRSRIQGQYGNILNINNTEFHDFQFIYGYSYLNLEDIKFVSGTFGVYTPLQFTEVSMSGLWFVNCNGTIYMQNVPSEFTVKNIKSNNTNSDIVYYPSKTYVANWVDCEVNPNNITVYNVGVNTTGVTQFKSTFEWLLEDNINVKVYDINDNLVLDKDVNNGDTDEIMYAKRTIIRGTAEEGLISNELEVYEPFNIVVSRAGYLDLNVPNVSIEPGQVTTIRASLIREPLEITAIDITNVTKSGDNDGQLVVTVSGGDQNYEYSINNINWQASNTFTGLAAGTYMVYVRDGQTPAFTDSFAVKVPLVTEIKDRLILF